MSRIALETVFANLSIVNINIIQFYAESNAAKIISILSRTRKTTSMLTTFRSILF